MPNNVEDDSHLMGLLNQSLADLESTVKTMDSKRGSLFLSWLKNQNRYLKFELRFNPNVLKSYSRGDVVHLQLGFNTGSEIGGPHWGVVLDARNAKSAGGIFVMPLSSLKPGQGPENVHPSCAFLGKIRAINDLDVFAITNQMRTVSKMRITRPKTGSETAPRLTTEQLNLIDEKIYSFLFSSSKVVQLTPEPVSEVTSSDQEKN